MRHFMAVHDDVVLLAAWHNQWPQSAASMANSWLLNDWTKPFADLPRERVIELPAMANEKTPGIYEQAHIGLFPNRCEAGTNLVMCEFMACGRPVIATNATGHADVFSGYHDDSALLSHGTEDAAGWFNPNVSDILCHLEWCYGNQDKLADLGAQCRKLIEPFTWEACARKIFAAAFTG